MKRLFALRTSSGTLVRDMNGPNYFSNKVDAKKYRDQIKQSGEVGEVFVTLGPDHDGKVTSQHRNSRKRRLRGKR